MKTRGGRYFWLWPCMVLAALAAGVFMKVSSPVLEAPYMDKLAHALYLGLVATLLSRRAKFWVVLGVGVFLSFGIEIGQIFVPYRSSDIVDAWWGVGGTLVAWGCYQMKFYRAILEYKLW